MLFDGLKSCAVARFLVVKTSEIWEENDNNQQEKKKLSEKELIGK